MTKAKHTPDSLADELDQLLPPGGRTPVGQNEDPLLDAALRLAKAPRPTLSTEASARIQELILRQARQRPEPLRPNFAPVLRWGLVASVLLVVMLIPTSQVALASVPGELFYPLKERIEQLETRLATSPESRAGASLIHAERRTQEFDVLLSRGQFEPSLLDAAHAQLMQASALLHNDNLIDVSLAATLESRVQQINLSMATLLDSASQPDSPLAATVVPYNTSVAASVQAQIVQPATASPTASPSATPTNTQTPTDTFTPTDTQTATPTASPTATATSTLTPTATLEVNIVIMGPIEAIEDNTIVIYGIEFVLDDNNPLLDALEIGDVVRMDGQITNPGDESVTAAGISTESNDDSLAISEDGSSVWRDDGNCDNPPPDWAPANGWRQRCDAGSEAGGNSANPGNGNQGQGVGNDNQGSNNGQGQGNNGDNGNPGQSNNGQGQSNSSSNGQSSSSNASDHSNRGGNP